MTDAKNDQCQLNCAMFGVLYGRGLQYAATILLSFDYKGRSEWDGSFFFFLLTTAEMMAIKEEKKSDDSNSDRRQFDDDDDERVHH